MEPKFQSSFIPKGPIVSNVPGAPIGRRTRQEKSLFYILASTVFIMSVLSALGMFGYKFYLKYSIDQMGANLEDARLTLQPEVIRELTRLDNRILSSQKLLARHQILSPLFEFFEVSTPKTVRFKDFSYTKTPQGLELKIIGEARGYAALPVAEIERINKMLPDNINTVRLALDLDSMASRYGISIDSIKVEVGTAEDASLAVLPEYAEVYDKATVSLGFISSYADFMRLLADIEKSLRIMDIKSVALETNESGLYEYEIAVETYWLK